MAVILCLPYCLWLQSWPSEMIDQIGGWSKRSVGQGYGEGYEVGQLHAHLSDIV